MKSSFRNWWVFAIIVRLIASFTHSHWFHPDEWCQTIEPANLLAHGFGFHSQEIGLHLRNLSWPVFLAGLLKWTQWVVPNSVSFRIFSLNLLCGSLDLLILWGWTQLLRFDSEASQFTDRTKKWSLALLLLPWFTVYGSVSPRGEHLSEIAFWVALGCMSRGFWILSGIASVAIFAVRYPSGLLSLGLFISFLIQYFKTKNRNPILKHSLGIIFGFLLFGMADFWIYGRPWESLWMYLQYNVFTGSSALVFGKQGIETYQELFFWNWATYPIFIPLGLTLLLCCLFGFYESLKKLKPWSICLFVYLLGHCLVPHKEGRFIIPVETLIRWSAFFGFALLIQKQSISQSFRKPFRIAIGICLIANALIFIHHLRADFWKDRGTYKEIKIHLEKNPNVCAVLTNDLIHSIHLPFEQNPLLAPSPAMGTLNSHRDGFEKVIQSQIAWIEHTPECKIEDSILLHIHRPEDAWINQESCTLLPSGILKFLPTEKWNWAIQNKLVAGVWYRCPSKILAKFSSQRVYHYLSTYFGHLESLPPLGISPAELRELGNQTSPPPRDSVAQIPEN